MGRLYLCNISQAPNSEYNCMPELWRESLFVYWLMVDSLQSSQTYLEVTRKGHVEPGLYLLRFLSSAEDCHNFSVPNRILSSWSGAKKRNCDGGERDSPVAHAPAIALHACSFC